MPRKRSTPPTEPHATDLQVQQRVEELLRIRLDGAEIWDVREYVREKVEAGDPVWGKQLLSDAQIYRYLERVKALIAESCREPREQQIEAHLAKRRNLYAKAVQQGDMRAALAIARDEAELLSLYPPRRTELSGANGAALPGVLIIGGVNIHDALGTVQPPQSPADEAIPHSQTTDPEAE